MNLKLYDYNEKTQQGVLRLKKLNTYQERLDYIQKHFFDIKKYKKYYTQNPNRWLGIKQVNKPHKNEHVKIILDFIAGYLLNSKEYSTHDKKKRYLELLELKSNNGVLEADLYNELLQLSKDVIYHKPSKSFKMNRNLVFIENHDYMMFLEKCRSKYANLLKEKNDLNYTETYCLKKTEEDFKTINEIINKVKSNLKTINRLKKRRKVLKKIIKENYEKLKDNKSNFCTVLKHSKNFKKINDEIKFLENEIVDLYNDYYFLTEHKVSNQLSG